MTTIPTVLSSAYIIPGIGNSYVIQKGGIDLFFVIRDTVCKYYGVNVNLLTMPMVSKNIALCRRLIAYFAKQKTTLTTKIIAFELGKDVSSINRMLNHIYNEIDTTEVIRMDIANIKALL